MNTQFRPRNTLGAALLAGAATFFSAAPTAHAAVIYTSLPTPLGITNSLDGIYINVVTGVTGASGAAVPGWDLNPYNNNSGLTFYGAASPSGILATGTAGTTAVAQVLTVGSLVSPTPATGFYNQFQTTAPGFQSAGDRYVGFRFLNETTGATNYGWMQVRSSAGTPNNLGFPASILSYAYENTGLAINVGLVPEPSTFAMFGVALAGAFGLSAAKRRSRS